MWGWEKGLCIEGLNGEKLRLGKGEKVVGGQKNGGRGEKQRRSEKKAMEVGKKSNGAMDLGRGNKDEIRAARTGRKVEKWKTGREIMLGNGSRDG